MKQIIVAQIPSSQISVNDVVITSDSIIVQVYNNHVSFLSEMNFDNTQSGFCRIAKYPNWNTCSDNAEIALARCLKESPSTMLYVFDSLKDLACAIIENNWK